MLIGTGICLPVECYPYMEDLKELEQRASLLQVKKFPQYWQGCPHCSEQQSGPVAPHPDKEFSSYVLKGIHEGFKIGFEYQGHSCTPAKANMRSAVKNPTVVEEYLAMECELGGVICPLDPWVFPHIRFGVIPKPHQPGKWRLIVDLSYPASMMV